MEEIKKQILLINLANYNETVNNMSKFKLNDREIKLFCDIMQQFAEKYHTEQLRTHDVVERREQLVCDCVKCKPFHNESAGYRQHKFCVKNKAN